MIKDIKELNFPAYATLETATATIADMGDRTITSQVKIDGDVVPDFSYDWEVEFKGERYIHPVRTPQGTKDNASRKSKIDLVFQHWAVYEMKRQYFVEMASTTAGTAIADKYIASLGLNLGDFVSAFNLVLNHYFNGRIVIRFNPEWQYDAEAQFVSISYSYIWDVLQQMHEIYGVRWTLKTNANGVCEILMGYPAEEVSHIFEYGFEGGLLSVQRQVQSTEIRNRLLGRGGNENLPYRYFKDKDPNNPLFEADPDWIPELANIAFTELRGKTFRDYVRGWKAKRYGGTPMAEPTEAYLAGYNAEKFDPIEYVDDKESIEKYGVLVGALENNEEIYPSIQGAPGEVDMIVDAEQVTDDDVDTAVENDSVTTNLEPGYQTYRNAPANSTVTIETRTKRYFSVPEGKVGNLSMSLTATGKYSDFGDYDETHPILKSDTVKVTIHDKITGAEVKSSSVPVVNIPAGDYYYMISVDVETNYDRMSMVTLNIESVYLYTSTPNKSEGWNQTFDIWVRNIWGSSRNAGETDQQYADRVWAPILGDRMGGEARVVFASGWLSFSSDWEFPIVGYAYDDSKEGSHWRLTLAKSEAELEASGKYIPYEGYNASAGDRFFFIGIDMPYQYVLWAEERLDDYKRDALLQSANINPTWVIKTDKVRLNQDRDGVRLIDSLSAGAQIRLASKQFVSGAYESLYVQSMTYNWTADTILYPDVEVVVSDKVTTVKNPVAQIQSNIESIKRQMGSLSNLQQIFRQICDKLYLRKDGISDVSKSPTKFLGKVTGENFRQGQIGGRDWGIYRDENGNAILEADKLVARQGILVSNLVVNEAIYVGGLQINSAASMKITAVEDTASGYVCSFDQKQGSVINKFVLDDIALCQKFDAGDNEVKFYKRRVVSVSETSVTLSKTDVNGTGVPAEGDVIIHYGNYTDKSRQFVIIRDVIGGGYERMLMGLDSVTSDGIEYYFAGKSTDSKARWFVGEEGHFAKYEDGEFSICGKLTVGSSGLENLSEWAAKQKLIDSKASGEDFDAFKELVGKDIEEIQKQVDGAITTWFYDVEPTLTNAPAVDWTTDEDKNNHLGDLYYSGAGKAYRFQYDEATSAYYWNLITDEDITQALALAQKAQDTADGKRRVFVDTPTPPYDEGDLWSQGPTLPMMICVNGRAEGSFQEDDWDFADNTSQLATQIAGYEYIKEAIQNGNTIVTGGLIQSGVLMLGHTNASGQYQVMSGTNGIYDSSLKGGGIAAWYGGLMVDREAPNAVIEGAATSLHRFDGSGYFAKGNISWSADGAIKFAGGKLSITKNGALILSDDIAFGSDSDETIQTIISKLSTIMTWFQQYDENTIYTPFNFVTGRQIAAGQAGTASGGGTGSLIFTGPWSDYASDKADYSLAASLGYDLHSRVSTNSTNISSLQSITSSNTSRITALEGKATNVSFAQSIAAGKQIGTISIDGKATNLYAPSTYAWSEITSKPTFATVATSGSYNDLSNKPSIPSIAGLASESWVSNNFLGLSGGTITGDLSLNKYLRINAWSGYGSGSCDMWYNGNSGVLAITAQNITNYLGETFIHSGNYNSYSPTLTGTGASGTWGINISGNATTSTNTKLLSYTRGKSFDIDNPNALIMSDYGSSITISNRPSWFVYGGIFTINTENNYVQPLSCQFGWDVQHNTPNAGLLYFRSKDEVNGWRPWTKICTEQSGNAISATKLQTARTIWGQSFDGSRNIGDSGKSQWLFLNSGGEGIYFSGAALSWHNSSNSYVKGLMVFNSSGNVTIGASDLAGTGTKLYVDNGMVTIVRANSATQYYGDNATFKICTANPSGASVVLGLSAHTSEYCTIQSTKVGTGAMRLSINPSGGNVLIGTTTDYGYKLYVNGTSYLSGNTAIGGSLKIGSATLTWNGSALVVDKPLVSTSFAAGATATASTSDMRLKTVDSDISLDIHSIANAPLFNYHLNEHSSDFQMVGSSAQYWMSILPKSVVEDGTDNHFLSLFYDRVALASAISTARVVVSHEDRITELEELVRMQEEEIKYLKSKLN